MNNKSLIAFIDASGTFDLKDRFFGVGMLILKDAGEISDKLHIIFQRILTISQGNRDKTIQSFISKGDYQSVISMLRKAYHFELKFDRLGKNKKESYEI